jgi:low temperature requirement protein LtrA
MKPLFRQPHLWVKDEAEQSPRHATWLELFYDLVFVVAVSQLAHKLSADVTIKGFLSFVFLFVPVWWSWIGTTFYANRFDSDDLIRRILMALQMLTVAALAVNIHHALDDSSAGFAIAYAASRFLLVLEYLWAGWHIPIARGLTQRYTLGFGIGALLWLISAFVPMPMRFSLWVAGLVIDFVTPLSAQAALKQLPLHLEHLPERFGLFTIIVLGEAILAVVNGVSEVKWGFASTVSAITGFVTAFSLWWVYFENISGSVLETAQTSRQFQALYLWLYIHLPLVIGLAATGVGVEHAIKQAGQGVALPTPDRWLICGSVAICYVSLAFLHRMGVIFQCKARTRHRLGGVAAMLGLAISGGTVSPLLVITAVAIVGLIQVGLDIYQGKPELV